MKAREVTEKAVAKASDDADKAAQKIEQKMAATVSKVGPGRFCPPCHQHSSRTLVIHP